jgi:hypothetical protein
LIELYVKVNSSNFDQVVNKNNILIATIH